MSPRSAPVARRNHFRSGLGVVNEMSVRGVMIMRSTSAGGFTNVSVRRICCGFQPCCATCSARASGRAATRREERGLSEDARAKERTEHAELRGAKVDRRQRCHPERSEGSAIPIELREYTGGACAVRPSSRRRYRGRSVTQVGGPRRACGRPAGAAPTHDRGALSRFQRNATYAARRRTSASARSRVGVAEQRSQKLVRHLIDRVLHDVTRKSSREDLIPRREVGDAIVQEMRLGAWRREDPWRTRSPRTTRTENPATRRDR